MARRFRRLRRAASQVIEVSRRFWRFCNCCGTMRTCYGRDVIPVSVAISCTNLPPVRTPIFCCHLPMSDSIREPCESIETNTSSSVGTHHWIRPTASGPQSDQEIAECSTRHQNIPCRYMPGSFSSDYQVTQSGINFARSIDQPQMILRNSTYLMSQPWRSPSHSFCAGPVSVWSISGSSQTDDHVPFRFLEEPRLILNPAYKVDNEPRTSNGSDSGSFPFSSDVAKILTNELEKLSRASRRTPPRAVDTLTTSLNSMVPSMIPVEVPCTSYLRVVADYPRPSSSSVTVIPPSSPRQNMALLGSVPSINVIPPAPSSTNPMSALSSPADKICSGAIYSIWARRTSSSTNSSVIVLDQNSLQTSSGLNSDHGTLAVPGERSRPNLTHSSRTIGLPGNSQVDPELRLNLNLLMDSSVGKVISPDIHVDFAIKSGWGDIGAGNWHHRKTLARTNCGKVTMVFCEKFGQDYVLKTLPTEDYSTEVEILQQCQSPFVAEMHAVLTQGEDRLLCMSYYERLDLSHWLRKDPDRIYFTENHATLICSYILTGLEFLHNKGYLHLDIKPGNILLCTKGYPVIGDFGTARGIVTNSGPVRRYTPSYASPEVLRGETPTNQADLWSTACVFYEVVAGRSPYKGQTRTETEMKILACATPDVSMLSLDAQHFIYAQIKSDKTDRLGFSFGAQEVTIHRIFHSINWDRIKYGHRHSDCRLLQVIRAVEQAEAAPRQLSISSVCNNNNSHRRELWSSSSSEGSGEEFSFSQRVIFTVQEKDEDSSDPVEPVSREEGEVDSYGVTAEPCDSDERDDGGGG